MGNLIFVLAAWQAVLVCLLFSIIYVGSLYIWPYSITQNRDHHNTIKQRFISIAIVCLAVPILLWFFGTTSASDDAHSLLEWIGVRFAGLIPAMILPLMLTMILFAGPLTMHYYDGVFMLYLEKRYWTTSVRNITWLRNHIVAPLSEEFIFRACMLPLLVHPFGISWSIILSPLLFGVAHFHHMVNKVIHEDASVGAAFKEALFQMLYTSVFGAYSAYLFLRTGHLLAPVIAHSFCNHMGFPAFGEIWAVEQPKRAILMSSFVLGLISWWLLMGALTTPWLYSNEVYVL